VAKLTKRVVDAIQPDDREIVLKDSELPGFGIRVKPSGRKLYFVHYRNAQGRQRKLAIGLHGVLTPDDARRKARAILVDISNGEDPAEIKRERRRGATIAELAERYLREHAEPKKKPSSLASDQRLLAQRILPALGPRRVEDVNRADVMRLHHQLRSTPVQANRMVAVLSKMMNLAELWGLRPDGTNPCRHVERYRERRRERFLSEIELARLGDTLAAMEREYLEAPQDEAQRRARQGHRGYRPTETLPPAPVSPVIAAAVRLLVFTGARRGEVVGLRWKDVDVERRCLRFEDSKTGARVLPLNTPAFDVLSKLQFTSEWVFPIDDGTRPVSLSKPWERIRTRASLPGLRLHDLRHSFASVAAAGGMSLLLIGRMLGHTVPATTARYAHLADHPLRDASERTGARIAAAFYGTAGAELIPLTASR